MQQQHRKITEIIAALEAKYAVLEGYQAEYRANPSRKNLILCNRTLEEIRALVTEFKSNCASLGKPSADNPDQPDGNST